MSDSARYHTAMWLKGKTRDEIEDRIAEIEAEAEWKGVEFDDIRVRHKRATTLEVLREAAATAPSTFLECEDNCTGSYI